MKSIKVGDIVRVKINDKNRYFGVGYNNNAGEVELNEIKKQNHALLLTPNETVQSLLRRTNNAVYYQRYAVTVENDNIFLKKF